jgi:hypothetical protein
MRVAAFLFALLHLVCAAPKHGDDDDQRKALPQPDPALSTTVQLNGMSFINKVCRSVRYLAYILRNAIGNRRLRSHPVQLQRVYRRHTGWSRQRDRH